MNNKQKVSLVRQATKEIQALKRQQDKIFNALCKRLGINSQGPKSNILFDACFNKGWTTATEAVQIVWRAQDATKSSEIKSPTIQDQDKLASPGDLR